jgi:hypothetical protein
LYRFSADQIQLHSEIGIRKELQLVKGRLESELSSLLAEREVLTQTVETAKKEMNAAIGIRRFILNLS